MNVKQSPPERRHPADYRDEQEHAEVARILAALSADHPARVAYESGAREASDFDPCTVRLCKPGENR